jgi:hypothetical protein
MPAGEGAAADLRLFRYSEADSAWDVVYGSYYDSSTGSVVGQVSQFGLFEIAVDTLPPVVTPSAPATVSQGSGLSISVDVDDNVVTKKVVVYYKLGGENEYRDTTIITTGATLNLDFGPDMSSPRGFEYYAVAEDGTNVTLADAASVQVAVSGVEDEAPVDTMAWHLISVPMSPTDTSFARLFKTLGDYDPTRWKAYAYENGQFIEVMKSEITGTGTGKSYWLKLRDASFTLTTGEALSVPTDRPFEIVLKPGWNLISNPFMFDVSWTALKQALDSAGIGSQVIGPFTFNGEKWRIPWPIGDVVSLETWNGYAFNNESSQDVRMPIPASAYTHASAKKLVRPRKDFWVIGIKARNAGAVSAEKIVGIHPAALDERDGYDYLEPPALEEKVSLRIARNWSGKRRSYLTDIRAPIKEGSRWTFGVENAHGDVALEFDLSSKELSQWEVYLYDAHRKFAVNLRDNPAYTFVAARSGQRSFTLVVGTHEYCDKVIRNFEAPRMFALSQNFPNPFNELTYIYYQLPKDGSVKLAVFNAQGRVVAELVNEFREAGYYRAVWKTRDERGRPVASGVYLYQMIVHDRQGRKVLFNKIRVMRLMK